MITPHFKKHTRRITYPLVVPQTQNSDFGHGEDEFIHGIVDTVSGSSHPSFHHIRRDQPMCNQRRQDEYLDSNTAENLQGKWLYAGGIFPHFGHFLAECCHRIWAWKYFEDELDGIIFVSKPNHQNLDDLPPYISHIIRLLGIPLEKVKLVNHLSSIEELIVPEPGSNLMGTVKAWYKPELKALMKGANLPSSHYGYNLFISREGYTSKGRVLGMDSLGQILKNNGYDIILPDKLPLEQQLAALLNAKKIIWEEGSSIHLTDLLPKIQAKNFLISRRPYYPMFARMLSNKSPYCFHYTPVETLPHISRNDNIRYDSISLLKEPDDLLNQLHKQDFLNEKLVFDQRFYQAEMVDLLKYLKGNSLYSKERLNEMADRILEFRSIQTF